VSQSPKDANEAKDIEKGNSTNVVPAKNVELAVVGREKIKDGKNLKSTPSKEYQADEHLITVDELVKRYNTNGDKGLTSEHASDLLVKNGPNILTPPKETPEIIKFLKCFLDLFMLLLLAAGVFCLIASGLSGWDQVNLTLAIVLFVVVFLTVCMTYFQDRQASAVMSTFKKMLPSYSTVIRNGRELRIPASELVVGDLVKLGLGDKVPADIRIIISRDLKVECSSLTGESDAIAITVESHHDLPLESRNIVFNSSLVMNGEGIGIVIRTGDHTLIGSIAALASSTENVETTMQIEVRRVVHFITYLALASAIIFFSIGVGRVPSQALTAFVNGFIVVFVANVPEGLPATVTSCLTITAKRMSARSVFIKKTAIIETLGSASVICSDKTGTLTQNKMSVENMWINKQIVYARGYKRNQAPIAPSSAAHPRTNSSVNNASVATGIPGDIAAIMTVGRKATLAGDGTIRLEKVQGTRTGLKEILENEVAQPTMYSSFSSFAAFGGNSKASWSKSNPFMKLVTIAGVCNRARFTAESDNKDGEAPQKSNANGLFAGVVERKVLGDASDTGFLRYVDSIIPIEALRLNFPVVFEIPFNSVNKWSYAIVKCPEKQSTHIGMLKGAPEIVVTKCTHYLLNGVEKEIDDEFKSEYMAAYQRFGLSGERVIGFAYKTFPGAWDVKAYGKTGKPFDPLTAVENEGVEESAKISEIPSPNSHAYYPTSRMVFAGLISLVDPPREGVDDAVAKCRGGGIKVTMVTGDHPLTAEAIARKVGIITLPTQREVAADDGVDEDEIPLSDPRVRAVVRAGAQIRDLTQDQWDEILSKEEVVFARTSPQQKLEICENYQRRGELVAMTGDGVNDSPALKRANIGIAMGSPEASDVAREAAGEYDCV
jgi:sodium/potassium-transporting ATPase subunit alpha